MRYAAQIFDFDGTLVDTGDLNLTAVHAALADHGMAGIDREWLASVSFGDLANLRRRLRDDLGARLACTDREFAKSASAHWLANTNRVTPLPEIVALARTAAASGPVAVASANAGAIVRAGLAVAELEDLVTVVVAREDVTRLKPAPDAYLVAAGRLGVAPDHCLAYENTDDGVTAARAARMRVVDIRERAQPS